MLLDLAELRGQLAGYYEALRFRDRPYGQYRMQPSDPEPTFYASLDAALARTVMGEDLVATLPANARAAWIAHLRTFQHPDGSYRQLFTHHHQLHAHGMAVGALGALGGTLPHPATLHYAPFDTPAKAIAYLESSIDWTLQWTASHQFWGGLHIYSLSAHCSPAWRDAVFAWLVREVDPQTGWWRVGHPPADGAQALGGGAHIWPIFEHHQRPFPAPARVIDRILELQSPAGNFAGHQMGSYLHLDALYALKYLGRLVPDYRPGECADAVERHARWLVASYPGYLAAQPNAHYVLALAGQLGLVHQLRPDLFPDRTGAVWSDIFTCPALYRTAAVEGG